MRTLVNTTLALTLLVLFSGCDITNVIDRTEPSTSVSQQTAITTEDGAVAIRARMYNRLQTSPALTTDWMLGASSMADNTFFRASSGRHSGLNLNTQGSGLGTGARNDIYDTINLANLLINGLEEGVLPADRANKFEAEARFVRALVMHHNVRIFGYDPMSPDGPLVTPQTGPGAGFELGDVIKTDPTLGLDDAQPLPRSPVLDVYDQIVTDLQTAIDLFSNLPGGMKSNTEHFATEVSSHALLARVQLYQRNYSAAEQEAQTALDQASSRFGSGLAAPNPQAVYDIFDERNGNPEAIFTVSIDPIAESGNFVNTALAAYTSTQWMAQLPTQELISLYGPNDVRLDTDAEEGWYAPCFNDEEGSVPAGCNNVNQQGLELQKYNAERGSFADNIIHLRVAEMKLIQAEARLNGASGSAAAPLNDLRNARGLDDLSPSEVTMDEILEERRRELVAEGHRVFDLKRLGRDLSKSQGKLDTPPQEDLPFSDFRYLDDISDTQIGNNPELVQNPGY